VRKLVESTFVTLDGVIDDPQPQVWGHPYWDDEFFAYARRLLFASDALLLGRVTYEGFATSWPSRKGDDFADRINALPKHVASRTLTETTWNATLIEGDVAAAVRDLKEQPGEDILKYGTGELDRTLMPASLVDELHLWVMPVIAGGGVRLLDGVDLTHLRRLGVTTFANGIVVLVYGPKEDGSAG
jgi:dihydrofolate reductase